MNVVDLKVIADFSGHALPFCSAKSMADLKEGFLVLDFTCWLCSTISVADLKGW